LIAHSEAQERALWSAALALEEADVVANEAASHLVRGGDKVRAQGAEKRRQSDDIRAVLRKLEPFTPD
jgi:hypothetical protein